VVRSTDQTSSEWPIVNGKDHAAPSVFRPEALLREARRQKGLPLATVPEVCILDPDGDVVRHFRRTGAGRIHQGWACYHTELLTFDLDGVEAGIIGCAVGAPFAVLVAEQLFASGCRLLISVTSAGQIADNGPTPYFVLIDRALRDEGTSYHYLPAAKFAEAPTPGCSRVSRNASWGFQLLRFIAAPPGRRMRLIGKPKLRSQGRLRQARSPWKWKPPLFMPSPMR
jgi:hypothetical protein